MQYITDIVTQLCSQVDVTGMKVLEVGGDSNFFAARQLLERGAASVTTTNIDGRQGAPREEERLSTRFADAHHLHRFFDEKFDLVFGIAVIEHVLNLPMLLSSTREVLKPGGLAFYHGDPIWTWRRGHHVWVDGENGRPYRFNEESTVIPDWHHLIYTPNEMRKHLIKVEKISPGDAELIVYWVYFSPEINRHSQIKVQTFFERAPMKIVHQKSDVGGPPPNRLKSVLDEKVGDNSDFRVAGITYLLKRD